MKPGDKLFYSNVRNITWQPSDIDDCISFLASTASKLNIRIAAIKEEFPQSQIINISGYMGYLRCTIQLGEYKDGNEVLEKKYEENQKRLKEMEW